MKKKKSNKLALHTIFIPAGKQMAIWLHGYKSYIPILLKVSNNMRTGTLAISFSFSIRNFTARVISTRLFLHQSLLSTNINSPIKYLLILINQSFTLFRNFSTELKFLDKMNDIWYEI